MWNRHALVLTTRGRKSGLGRTVPLQFFPYGDRVTVVAANSGLPSPPDWYFNLTADPRARLDVAGRTLEVPQAAPARAGEVAQQRVVPSTGDLWLCLFLAGASSLDREVIWVTKSRTIQVAVLVVTALALGACAAGPNNVAHVDAPHIAGFWLGLWHGAISPITFLVSLFNHGVNIYDVHNNGNWYNFGFMLGVSAVFSGAARPGAAARRPSRSGKRASHE